ncbi:UNVERIFIED_CONTAM: hypothetical protein RMT77_016743 [Armadillidium vulgare]
MSQPFASNLRNKSRKHIQSVVEEEINCKIHNSSKTNKTQIVEELSGEIHSDAVLETCLAAKPNYKANFGGEFSDKTISAGKSENDQGVTKEVISKGKLIDSDRQILPFEDENNEPTRDSQTGMTKKTAKPKPKRPCLYCKKKFTNVSHHMKRIHADETDVEKILTFPKKDQDSEMRKLLKRGVHSHSLDLFKSNKNAEDMMMRKEKIENEVVICENCFGTCCKSKFYLHEKTCNGGLKIVVERKSIVGEFSEKYFEEITTYSEVSKLCRRNPINLQYGKYVLNSSVTHSSKKGEKKKVMMSMRLLVRFLLKFVEIGKNKSLETCYEDIFNSEYFPVVEETIYAIIEKKKVVQLSIMLHLQAIINSLINSMNFVYTVEKKESKKKLLLDFKEVFKHRSELIFNASHCHVKLNRTLA